MRDYSFPSTPHLAANFTTPIDVDVTGATLTFEFSDTSNFTTIRLTKTATGAGKSVTIFLTATEVEALKDAAYRVTAVVGGQSVVVVSGRVDYQPSNEPPVTDISRVLPLRGDSITRIAVPSYFYPTYYNAVGGSHDWENLQAAAPTAELCIVNPSDGPGVSANSDYQTQLHRAVPAGLTVLGYVATNYGAIDLNTVKAQIDSHRLWYGVEGIFFDQCSSDAAKLPYYAELYAYVKDENPDAVVVINPGSPSVDENYMTVCDIVVNFENSSGIYGTTTFPSWTVNYPALRFWHIVYSIPDTTTRDSYVTKARQNRAGYIYLTDLAGYVSLPTDWTGLVTQVVSANGKLN